MSGTEKRLSCINVPEMGVGKGVGKGDIRNCFGKLNDPGKPALRRLGILRQQLGTSPLFAPMASPLFAPMEHRFRQTLEAIDMLRYSISVTYSA